MTPNEKRELVFVPAWVAKQLKRSNLRINAVLNLNELSKVCSKEDIALTYKLNTCPAQVGMLTGKSARLFGLENYWFSYADQAEIKKIQDLLPLYEGRLEERLFSTNVATEVQETTDLAGKAFDVMEMSSDLDTNGVIFVTVYPGFFNCAVANTARCQLLRAYLKQSYVFCNYDKLATDIFFDQYVRNLQ